jgi:hypothetical protein
MCTIQRGARLSAQHPRAAQTPVDALQLAQLSRSPPMQASQPCRAATVSAPNSVTTRRQTTSARRLRQRPQPAHGSHGQTEMSRRHFGGIWSAGGVGDFAHELFEDVRRHLPTSRYPEPNGADSTGFSYTSE